MDADVFATEAEAAAEARRRNEELGARGATEAFWVDVARPGGGFRVEQRSADEPGWKRLIDRLGDVIPPV